MQISRSDFDVLHLMKHSDLELYAYFLLNLDLSDLTLAGTYDRAIVSSEAGTQKIYSVKVIRVRKHGDMSHRTFSLRPDLLFPHSPYSIKFILSVIYHYYFTRNCCIPDFINRWQISRSTLYSWLTLFKSMSSKWFDAVSFAEKTAHDMRSKQTSIPTSPRSFIKLIGYKFWEGFTPTPDFEPP